MNTSLSAYTNLESLLLFQSLHAYGVGGNIFSRVSDLLKNNPSINQDRRFQSGRLSPDALHSFYQQILSDEIQSENNRDSPAPHGPDARNTRKRKAPSPSLPSVKEAAQHAHLLPKLINKLYARYRAALTNEIRDDEERYDRLQQELAAIERGDRDNELLDRHNAKLRASRSPSALRKSPTAQQRPPLPSPDFAPAVQDASRKGTPVAAPRAVDGMPQNALGPPPRSSPDGVKQRDQNTKEGHSSAIKQQSPLAPPSAPGTPSPHSQQQAQNQQPQDQSPSSHPQPPTAPKSTSPQNSQSAPRPAAGSAPLVQPPHSAQSPRPAQPSPQPYPPANAPSPAPQAATGDAKSRQNQPQSTQERASQQQAAPPQGAIPHPSHQQPVNPYGNIGMQPYGPGHPQFPPNAQRYPAPTSSIPSSPNTPHQQRNFHPYTPQPPYPGQQAHPGPPHQGGFMLPPFQVSPQDPTRVVQQQTKSQVSTPVARKSQTPVQPGTGPASGSRLPQPPLHVSVSQARASISTPLSARSPYSATSTPRSAKTLWKSSIRRSGSFGPRPEVDPIDDLNLREQNEAQSAARPARRGKAKAKAKEKEPDKEAEQEVEKDAEPEQEVKEAEEEVPEMETRQGRSRRRAAGRRTRRGSITSSHAGGSARGRSRSRSVISHTETIAGENESQGGPRVKEERAASADVGDNESVGTNAHPTTRRRGGTLQTSTRGRKRNAREASLAESDDQPSPELSDAPMVIAPRHFSRMAHPVMNEISSHKHASTFTTAVKAKDAEGYYDIIKRPTDLKSITKAINAGAKIVSNAASDTPAGSPGGGGGIVELVASADTAPPKAIVNSAQLEKELMRMFVNAVMFNSGEEGVVADAREMFASTEQSVSNWRNAERSKGRLELDDLSALAQTPEEEAPPVEKKRRKG